MQSNYNFNVVKDFKELANLKNNWLETLTSPQDGMWEYFRDSSTHWVLKHLNKRIGYACINDENFLIQFYISPEYFLQGKSIFNQFIKTNNIKNAIVGTNNPVFLSLALNYVKELQIHTYLFRKKTEVYLNEKDGVLSECKIEDVGRIVDFCHYSMGAPKSWLNGYIRGLIKQKEVFVLEKEGEILGTCEIRKSKSTPAYANIGMIVSPHHRKKGYGTYLLDQATKIAVRRNTTPICSCEKNNLGSFKSISNCGYISLHQLLAITLIL